MYQLIPTRFIVRNYYLPKTNHFWQFRTYLRNNHTCDPTVGPRPKVWTRGQKWKWCRRWRAGGSDASQIRQRVSAGVAWRILLPFYSAL